MPQAIGHQVNHIRFVCAVVEMTWAHASFVVALMAAGFWPLAV
jgi:hypothetical protein